MQTQTKTKKSKKRKKAAVDPLDDIRRRIRDWQENDGDAENLPEDIADAIAEAPDSELADLAFHETQTAFVAGWVFGETAAPTPAAPALEYGGPEALYAKSKAHSRVLFLELLAWAISEAEHYDMDETLKEHRVRVWGKRPWSGAAKEDDAFLGHVTDMARTFAGADGAADAWYPNRKHGPLAGMDL